MNFTHTFKAFLLLFTVTLSACGFHPRGGNIALPLELKQIYLEGGSPALREQFFQQLRNASSELVESRDKASLVIKLVDEQFQRRGVSLSERGKTNEYELIYRLEYELTTPKDEILLARQPLEIRRDYYNDQQAILARDNEEGVLRAEMTKQTVQNLLGQARFALERKQK